jgi:cytochrome c oxidase subunit 2
MTSWYGLGVQASAHAAEIDRINGFVHWLMAVLFVGWGAFFLFCLFRFRRGRQPKADYDGMRSHFSTWTEVAVGAVEVLLLVAFSIPAWATRVNAFPAEHEATVVRVVAEQFAWNVHYPGPDGQFGSTDIRLISADNPLGLDRQSPHAADDITTINQLNLPVNRPAIVRLSTKDMIHSFGVHAFRVKQDAIPGMVIPIWFTPTVAGDYEIACSQLCGLGHYRMRGFISIQSDTDFQAWLKEQAALQ